MQPSAGCSDQSWRPGSGVHCRPLCVASSPARRGQECPPPGVAEDKARGWWPLKGQTDSLAGTGSWDSQADEARDEAADATRQPWSCPGHIPALLAPPHLVSLSAAGTQGQAGTWAADLQPRQVLLTWAGGVGSACFRSPTGGRCVQPRSATGAGATGVGRAGASGQAWASCHTRPSHARSQPSSPRKCSSPRTGCAWACTAPGPGPPASVVLG